MKKISTLNELQWFVGSIMEEGINFLSPIKEMNDNLDIFKVYEKTIELASNYFEVEITLENVPFCIKFELSNFAFDYINGKKGTDNFFKDIYSKSFNSNSKLLNEIKKDYRVCMDFCNLGCILDNYDWPYILLDHMYKNINNIPKTLHSIIMNELSFLLESLSKIIQKKLYNDEDGLLNEEIVKFNISFMQISNKKREETIVYQRLLYEHLELLRVYRQATQTLKRLQIRNPILA